jgi:hypothetical protein
MASNKYEGCGEIGDIRAIFLAQFHPDQGPMVRCQWPRDFLSKECFDSISRFIIPKNEIQAQTVTVNCLGYKISGYPTYLHDKKYRRNYLLFNLCLVCHHWSRTVQFEPFVRKLSQFFVNLEKESLLLSQGVEDKLEDKVEQIESMLVQVYNDMNNEGRSVVVCGQNSLQLSVIELGNDPPQVFDHQVPILSVHTDNFHPDQWDLTTTQIIPYLDGFNHIGRISALADVESNLVRACVENLVYHRVVTLISIFQYCNVYTVTPELAALRTDPELRRDLLQQAARDEEQRPTFRDVYTFLCSFTYGTTVKDLCARHNPANMGIDERRLVQYLLRRGILRRVFKYPVWSGEGGAAPTSDHFLYTWLTGEFHTDQVCVVTGLSAAQLDAKIEADSNIVVLWK